MSAGKGDTPRPYDPTVFGQNYDWIFRRDQIFRREYRSRCCLAKYETGDNPYDFWCLACGKHTDTILTKINP